MATWHQQKAGLTGLYSKPQKGYKVVIDQPGQFASAVEFSRKRDALRFIRNCKKLRGETGVLINAKDSRE